jgi:D-inositol-3-phosphate glycosyltransferase
MYRIAMISMHGCPLAKLGERDAGGMNVYVRELSLALGQTGHLVDVFTRCQDYSTTQIVELGPGARVIHIEAGDVQYIDKRDLFPVVPQFTERVLGFQLESGLSYDLVHSHYWLSGCSATVLQREWNLPMVHMFHTLGALKNNVARNQDEREPSLRITNERHIVAKADRLIAANPAEHRDLQTFYGADPARISIIPCGVDLELFRPLPRDQARALLNLPMETKIVLFVGRLEPIKGVDILLDALAHLDCDGCQGLALVVGGNVDSTEAARLLAIRDQLGLGDSVRLVGAQEQRNLPYFYAAADVCVVPSFYESFGMVAIEAMACGLPVIASRAGGLQFTVQDGQNGLLVPPGDSIALAAALQQLLTDEEMRSRLSAGGRRSASAYSWKRVAQGMTGVYGGLKEEGEHGLR